MLNVRLLLYSSALILYGCTCVTSEEECGMFVLNLVGKVKFFIPKQYNTMYPLCHHRLSQ